MKKVYLFVTTAILSLILVGCNKEQEELKFSLENYQEAINLGIDETLSSVITINANRDNVPVEIKNKDGEWINVAVEGNTIKIDITAATSPREGGFTIDVADKSYPVTIVQDKLSYNYFLGEFNMYYTNDYIEDIETVVTLSKKVEGESYNFTCARFDYDFEIRYNAESGSLYIKPQKLDTEEVKDHWFLDDGTYDIWLSLWGTEVGMSSPTIGSEATLLGNIKFEETGIIIVYEDGGGWDVGELNCITIGYFIDDYYQFDKYSSEFEATYFNISMEKR